MGFVPSNGTRSNGFQSDGPKESAITILGCGALGTAILSGLLASKTSSDSPQAFSHFIACVRREEAAKSIQSTLLSRDTSLTNVQILNCENVLGVQQADVVILACQPHLYREALAEPGITQALSGKLIVSVLAGVSEADIHLALGKETTCHVIRAMPNTASEVQDSMTVIPEPSSSIPRHLVDIADYIFKCVGTIRHINPTLMNVCTTLCGSSPAFFAVIVDALVNSAVSMGVKRADAVIMAAQAMRGTASLILEGKATPMEVRDGVTSPGGSTIVGVLKMEEGGVRSALDRALVATTEKAEILGRKREG